VAVLEVEEKQSLLARQEALEPLVKDSLALLEVAEAVQEQVVVVVLVKHQPFQLRALVVLAVMAEQLI
jgi:hypothetical protein